MPPHRSLPAVYRQLTLYFRSGWAFLIPYLAAYLLYAWLRWPVNVVTAGSEEHGARTWVPCLLHVYWGLHALHLLLAALALASWWREPQTQAGSHGLASTAHRLMSTGYGILPWVCLALLFWIPSVYLEFPADPWEHYSRINGCKYITLIQPGLAGIYKTPCYFLPYSLLGQLSVVSQLRCLDIYQALLSTLISWQYFLLARTCGLQIRAGVLFTIAQALLFGNDLFGFYRYYVLSSSSYSQLGAIAAIRLCVHLSNSLKSADLNSAPLQQYIDVHFRSLFAIGLALGLAAINHIQGLAIAGLGSLAVIFWHAAKCGRRIFLFLISLLILASAGCSLFWIRNPLIDTYYKDTGWLNSWGGFDLFSIHSNASHRMILILGLFGVFNLVAGMVLLLRNHIVGWLTLIPALALQFPFISIPIANAFADKLPIEISAFHRLFFAIPSGLALIVVGQYLSDLDRLRGVRSRTISFVKRYVLKGNQAENFNVYPRPLQAPIPWFHSANVPFVVLLATCTYLSITPAGYPYCNRIWNAWASVPADLRMTKVLTDFYEDPAHQSARLAKNSLFVASAATSTVLHAYTPIDTLFWEQRLMHLPQQRSPAGDLITIKHFMDSGPPSRPLYLVPPKTDIMFTPQSCTAYLSGHWNPVEVALAHTH